MLPLFHPVEALPARLADDDDDDGGPERVNETHTAATPRRGGAGQAHKKTRVLTEARRQQNREAQRLYRQRQRVQRERRDVAVDKSGRQRALQPKLVPRCASEGEAASSACTAPTSCKSLSHARPLSLSPTSSSSTTSLSCLPSSSSATSLSPLHLADPRANALEFAPTTIFSALIHNALCLGFDLASLSDCSDVLVSPFYQPGLASRADADAALRLLPKARAAAGPLPKDATRSVLNDHGTDHSEADSSSTPLHLRPTPAQVLVPHHASLDLIPLPRLREGVILLSAALPHLYSVRDLKLDVYERGGLRVRSAGRGVGVGGGERGGHAQPWEASSWEATPWFWRKWSAAVGGDEAGMGRIMVDVR